MHGAESEFDDAKRQELLQRLQNTFSAQVPPTIWACLWLSDIEKLQEFVSGASQFRDLVWHSFQHVEDSTKIVQQWTQRTRKRKRDEPSTPSRRLKAPRDQAHQRDQGQCVLTQAGEPNEVAHIFPVSLQHLKHSSGPGSIWATLRMFWSTERVSAWYDAIFQEEGTEVCHNLICLAPHAHAYWTRAHFALKPLSLSDDKKELAVQFYWLPSGISSHNHSEVDITKKPSLKNSDCGPNLSMLWNHKTRIMIQSGDTITLTTDDPELRPVPDFRLLEMQWFLHRVTALSAAAEKEDDVQSDSDEDVDSIEEWNAEQAGGDQPEPRTTNRF